MAALRRRVKAYPRPESACLGACAIVQEAKRGRAEPRHSPLWRLVSPLAHALFFSVQSMRRGNDGFGATQHMSVAQQLVNQSHLIDQNLNLISL
ncbi:hypothetical protein scyTo_0004801 [Scyliorhinus torazame]|uniref:Uncharacterized protein n=1 Tax=Scyliorhinus torazame TaxID=75743 RepID=A0A401NXB6_SCYTO|nr:hypothetical protein [Scyliorhinus torazame]